jgi:hypothetical protein
MKPAIPFNVFYETSLLPTLTELEGHRKKLVYALFIYIAVALAVAIPLWFVMMFLALVPFAVAGLIYFVKYNDTIKEKKHVFKREVIGKMIAFLDDSLVYEPKGYIDPSVYRRSKLFLADYNQYHGDDLVTGKIRQTAISFCELHTQRETVTVDSKGNRTKKVHTVFKGIFFCADFNKKFEGETFVLPDAAERLLGSLGTLFQKMNVERPQLVKLEDPEFEKAFVVHSTDQVEARYILSTALMQRILEFSNKTRRLISISFIDSQIFIAIPLSENMFEAPLFSSLINYNRIAKYHSYLELCVGVVGILDLNTRIWTKK